MDPRQDYAWFVTRVERATGLSHEDADAVTRTVLGAVSAHLGGGDTHTLADCLPGRIGDYVRKDRHASAEAASAQDFLARVANELDMNTGEAERRAQPVLAVLSDVVPKDVKAKVYAQLPTELREMMEARVIT